MSPSSVVWSLLLLACLLVDVPRVVLLVGAQASSPDSSSERSLHRSCNDLFAVRPAVIDLSSVSLLIVTGRCDANVTTASSALVFDVTNATAGGASFNPISIVFDSVWLQGPSVVVQSSHCAGVRGVAISVRSSAVGATRPYSGHPMGHETVAAFDVIATCDDPPTVISSSPSSWQSVFNVSVSITDSVVTATAGTAAGSAASVGGVYADVFAANATTVTMTAANATGLGFVALRSALTAVGGAGGATVMCVWGGKGVGGGLVVVGVDTAVDSSSLMAHRGGPSTGGIAPCGVLLVRSDAGAAAAFVTVVVSNSTLSASADWDGWVATASVMAAAGSAVLTASFHVIRGSDVWAVGGRGAPGGTTFNASVVVNFGVVAGRCPRSQSDANALRVAVWGDLSDMNNGNGNNNSVAWFDWPQMVSAVDSLPFMPSTVVFVLVANSNLDAATLNGGGDAAANIAAFVYGSSECGVVVSSNSIARLGTAYAPLTMLLDLAPSNVNRATFVVNMTEQHERQSDASLPTIYVIATNVSNLTATASQMAMNVAAMVGWGGGIAQWTLSGGSLVLFNVRTRATSKVGRSMSVVMGAALITTINAAISHAQWTAAGGSAVVLSGESVAETHAVADDLCVSVGAGVWNNNPLSRGEVGMAVLNGSLLLAANYSSVIAHVAGWQVAVAMGAVLWNENSGSSGSLNWTVSAGSLVMVTSHSTVTAYASFWIGIAIGASIANKGGYTGRGGLQWTQSNDSAVVVWGEGCVVQSTSNGQVSKSVSVGVSGMFIGSVVVQGTVRWIVAGGALVTSSGPALAFEDSVDGVTTLALSSNETSVEVTVCNATLADSTYWLLSATQLQRVEWAASVRGWFRASLCGATPSVRFDSNVAAISWQNCTVAPVDIGGVSPSLLSSSSSSSLATVAPDGESAATLLLIDTLLGVADGVTTPVAPVMSTCVAALYGSPRGVLSSRSALAQWGSIVAPWSGRGRNALSAGVEPEWSAWWLVTKSTTTASSTATTPSATFEPTVNGTLVGITAAPPTESTTTTTRMTVVSMSSAVVNGLQVNTQTATAPLLSTTRKPSPPSAQPSVTTSNPPALDATATRTTTTPATAPTTGRDEVAPMAVSHAAVVTVISALLGAPQVAARAPQSLRLLSLRRQCGARQVNAVLSAMAPPDPTLFVSVVAWHGSQALGAVASTAGALVAATVVAAALFFFGARNSKLRLRRRAHHGLACAAAALFCAAIVYYGPNLVAGAGAVVAVTTEDWNGAAAVTGADRNVALAVAATGLAVPLVLASLGVIVVGIA